MTYMHVEPHFRPRMDDTFPFLRREDRVGHTLLKIPFTDPVSGGKGGSLGRHLCVQLSLH